MKFEMKRYIILFAVLLFSATSVWSQPPPEDDCPCCEDIPLDPDNPLDPNSEYQLCKTACQNAINAGEEPCPAPVDSGILILFVLGTSFGIFKVYQNKKRQFEI